MKFLKNESKVKSFSTGRVNESGAYNCTITKCYIQESLYPDSQAESVHIDLVTASGQFLTVDLRIKSDDGKSTYKNGDDLIGIQQINDLMVVLGIDELSTKKGRVKIYDFDEQAEVEQIKTIFPQLFGQEIGCLIEIEVRLKKVNVGGQWLDNSEGKTKTLIHLRSFYSTESGRTAKEIIDNVEPTAIDNYLTYITAKKQPASTKQNVTASTEPAKAASVTSEDFSEDIQF